MALAGTDYLIHKGFLASRNGYTIPVLGHELARWSDELSMNLPLAPEIVGLLLGRATPAYKKELCRTCDTEIAEADAGKKVDSVNNNEYYVPYHKSCYERLAEGQEGNENVQA